MRPMKSLYRLLLLLSLFAPLGAHAQTADDPPPPQPSALYWRVQFFLRMDASTRARHITTQLPLTTRQQEVIALKKFAIDYDYSESFRDGNLVAEWLSLEGRTGANWVIYDATMRIKPLKKIQKLTAPVALPPDFKPQALMVEDKAAIRAKMNQLDLGNKKTSQQMRILYDFAVNSIELTKTKKNQSIKKTLELAQGNKNDKIQLFRAMTEELGLATRMVHGLKLKDRTVLTTTLSWIEVLFDQGWLPFDVILGHYSRLPQSQLTLYYGDNTLLNTNKDTLYTHQFVVTEMSEESVQDSDDLGIPQDNLFDKKYFVGVQKRESFIQDAIGRIAIITDDSVNPSLVEKISKQAARSDTKVHFYSAPYESTFFKGGYIAKLLGENLSTLQSADAIFILSNDDSGLYALFRLSKGKKKFKNTSIFISGNFSKPVANVLGYSLYKLLKPKELFIIPQKMEMDRAWDILQDSVLDARPLEDVTQRWNLTIMDLSKMAKKLLSPWRKFLINTWVLAAKAEVDLESVYLILILPIIALAVVIFRNVIGIETFGTFTPVIVSVAFLTTGLFWGILLFAIIVTTGVLFRQLFQKIHIHLVARMAMLIAVVGLTMLAILIFGVHMGWGALVNISILPMVIISGIVENFTRTQMEVGFKQALKLTFFTLVVSAFSYLMIAGMNFPSLVLVFPELTLLAILLEILIGRWNGLRLLEYLRFYKITANPNV